jgi:ABC-type anion transport system duplicated permease subunit
VTFARVCVLLLFATLVWVPIGVWIGLDPRVARIAQPIVQVVNRLLWRRLYRLAESRYSL